MPFFLRCDSFCNCWGRRRHACDITSWIARACRFLSVPPFCRAHCLAYDPKSCQIRVVLGWQFVSVFFLNRGVLFFHAQTANGSRSWVVFGYFRYVTYPLTTSDLNCFRHPNKTQHTRLASTVCWLNQGNCHYSFSKIVTRTRYLFEGNRTFASVCGVFLWHEWRLQLQDDSGVHGATYPDIMMDSLQARPAYFAPLAESHCHPRMCGKVC